MSTVVQVPLWTTPPEMPREASAAARRSHVHHWLASMFTGVQQDPQPVIIEFPPTYEAEAGELVELVRGIRDELRTRNQGRVTFVFATEDDVMRDAVRSIAAAFDAPIWVAPGASQVILAEPAIPLTPAKRSALESLAALGHGTPSAVATRTGSSPVSVGNVLAELYNQGLLLRESGGGRTGHTYVHPAMVTASGAPGPTATTVELPRSLSVEIADVASRIGRDPDELVAQAWRSFLEDHGAELSAGFDQIAGAMKTGDKAVLLDALTAGAEERAEATRHDRKRRGGPLAVSNDQSSRHE